MKITCGTDIIEINRIKKCIEDQDQRFINRIFTENEIKYCESKKEQKYQHYAARFAAKEATYKAISNILKNQDEMKWKDIEVKNNEQGKPALNTQYLQNLVEKDIEDIDISISHCREYAVANVTMLIK